MTPEKAMRVLSRKKPWETRQKRGYTIMEVTLVAFLSTILIVGVMRWLIGIGSVAGAQLSGAENTTLARATDAMRADLLSLRGCSETGTDAAISTLTPSTLALYTTSAGGNEIYFVTWTINGNDLTRNQVVVTSGQCGAQPPAPSAANNVTWAHDLDPQRSFFTLVRGGEVIPEGTQPLDGTCTNPWEDGCAVDAVDVTLTRQGDDQSTRRVIPAG